MRKKTKKAKVYNGVCKFCKTPFAGTGARQVFCSVECRKQSHSIDKLDDVDDSVPNTKLKNDFQLKNTLIWITKFKEGLKEAENQIILANANRDAVKSQIEVLEGEVEEYVAYQRSIQSEKNVHAIPAH